MIDPTFPPFIGITHMPFVAADGRMLFCRADELQERIVPQTITAKQLGIAPQMTRFRAWQIHTRPAWNSPAESPLDLPAASSSQRRYCTPVASPAGTSYIFRGTLWLQSPDGAARQVQARAANGFVTDFEKVTIDYVPDHFRIVFNDHHAIPIEWEPLRIIPAIFAPGYLITFRENLATWLLSPDRTTLTQLLVDGRPVYKSCLTPDGGVLHALRKGGFEDREIVYSPTYTLGEAIPIAELQDPATAAHRLDFSRATHRLWSEFHRAALADTLTADSMEDFNLRVDLLNVCQCGRHWRDILAAAPVLPPTDQFAWSVARHNDVNARLGKPLFTLEEAASLYA